MVSQVLFGEAVELIEEGREKWMRVKCLHDQYEGWVTGNVFTEVSEAVAVAPSHIAAGWVNELSMNGLPMLVPFGCELRGLQNGQAEWGRYSWSYKGNHLDPKYTKPTARDIRKYTGMFLNTPYLWGGRSVFGIDCSGFSQMTFRIFGIRLMRDAWQQATQGEGIGFLQEAVCGDLAFFDNAEGKITHVGILLNDSEIIHSSGKVRIDRIDNQGITNLETGERTHQLRLIRRYF